jgi:hypothetical protein
MALIKQMPAVKPPRPAPSLDEAIEHFRRAWGMLPPALRAETLLPLVDFIAQMREGVVQQAARLKSTETLSYVPFMVEQFSQAAMVYDAFLTLVVALAENADAEARGEAAGDDGERH